MEEALTTDDAKVPVILIPMKIRRNILNRPCQLKVKDVAKVWHDVLCPEQFQTAQRNCRIATGYEDEDLAAADDSE